MSHKSSLLPRAFDSFRDAVQLGAVFLLHARPENVARRVAVKSPLPLFVVRELSGNHLDRVFDFGGQQIPVLEADFGGRALQMNLDPAIALRGARSLRQARIGFGIAGEQCKRHSQQKSRKPESAMHCRYYSGCSQERDGPGAMEDYDAASQTDGAREGRGLSVQTQSKVVGPGSGERAPLGE